MVILTSWSLSISYYSVCHSALNEYGQKIHDTMVKVAADRYEKRVKREVEKIVLVSEKPSICSTGDDLSTAKLEALKVCEEKRVKACKETRFCVCFPPFIHCEFRKFLFILISVTALGGPKVSTSKGDYFVATPTNIRVV